MIISWILQTVSYYNQNIDASFASLAILQKLQGVIVFILVVLHQPIRNKIHGAFNGQCKGKQNGNDCSQDIELNTALTN